MMRLLDAYSTSEIALACGVLAILLFAGFCWLISYVPSRVFVKHGDEWQDLDELAPSAPQVSYRAHRIEDERVTLGAVVAISSVRKRSAS